MAPRKTCQRLVASCLAVAGGMLPATVFAQPPTPAAGAERATAHAVYVTESPRIDGVLDEPMWSAIEPVSAFTQRQPNEGAEPSERTKVRIAFNDRFLFFGITFQPDRSLRLLRLGSALPDASFREGLSEIAGVVAQQ